MLKKNKVFLIITLCKYRNKYNRRCKVSMLHVLRRDPLNNGCSDLFKKYYFIEWVVLMMNPRSVDVSRRMWMIATLLCLLSFFYIPSDGRAAAGNL